MSIAQTDAEVAGRATAIRDRASALPEQTHDLMLTFARSMTPRHSAISRTSSSFIASGVVAAAVAACWSKALRKRGCAQARTTSRLMRAITSCGVPALAARPHQYGIAYAA